MNFYPFSYKLFADSETCSGSVFSIPHFCARNRDNPKCRLFYKKLMKTKGFGVCPYGFGAEVIELDNNDIIFTCLNIEKKTDRILIRKYIEKADFSPRISFSEYKRIKDNFELLIKGNKPIYDISSNYQKDRDKLLLDRELLDNTIHEIRKLNNQLKGAVTRLNSTLSQLDDNVEYIDVLNLNIFSVSNLMSIRLDTYDLEVNPDLNLGLGKTDIAIYKKVEKIYKCLYQMAKSKNINIRLEGNSYNTYFASNIIELGFFIILENAIKYSPRDETVIVKFEEREEKLQLYFKNWGIRPGDDELKFLKDRGYRGKTVINQKEIEGRGIGLYLLNQICASSDINLKIKLGNDNRYIDNYRYSLFIVELKFENMMRGTQEII